MQKKIGIITFHNSYNCGSMLESYAIQTVVKKICGTSEIINFSNYGQKKLYSPYFKNDSLKNVIKNILLMPHIKKIKNNNRKYEEFKKQNFYLSKNYSKIDELKDDDYSAVIAGSDQIWNITIEDGDDAYFLPWVKKATKIAYAPSFGAKNIMEYSNNPNKYRKMICSFDFLSIREKNGSKWIKELCNKDVEVLLDPTLLLEKKDYEKLEYKKFEQKEKYIFFYSPSFDRKICKYVKQIANKYNLKVITWSAKSYYLKMIKTFGFVLADFENPSMYLSLIKNAELVMTTSYHGTIFSTIYRKKFIVIKNGGMYGNDDRVKTLLEQIHMENRLIPFEFDQNYNYLEEIDYSNYDKFLPGLKKKSIDYLKKSLMGDK